MLKIVRSPVKYPKNGFNQFILPVLAIDFYYCSHYGCSKGMREFLEKYAYDFARQYPQVQFTTFPKFSRGPLLRATYNSGYRRTVPVSNQQPEFIKKQLELLLTHNGKKDPKFGEKVFSSYPAVRPIWSPFHDALNCPLYSQ